MDTAGRVTLAKTFDSPEDLDAFLDDGIELDNQTHCPRCGFGPCDILSMPNPAGWWSRLGKARCPHCRLEFTIRALDEDPPD